MLNFLVSVAPPHSNVINLSASPTKEMESSIEISNMQLMASEASPSQSNKNTYKTSVRVCLV
jgi:hypothetical protein